MRDRSKIVADILKITKSDGSKYFDKLIDRTPSHLTKLLKVCTLIKK